MLGAHERQASPEDAGTDMTERRSLVRIEDRPTARAGLALVPATMTIGQAAAYIGVAKSTLYTWRTRRPGFGPRAVKAGTALRYRRSDLDAWIEANAEVLSLDPELHSHDDDRDSRRDQSPRSAH